MMIKPRPQINKVFSIVLQQEREILSVAPILEPAVFFNKSTQSYGRGGGRSGRGKGRFNYNKKLAHCTYCSHDNHTVDKCYCKYGFPIRFPQSASSGSIN